MEKKVSPDTDNTFIQRIKGIVSSNHGKSSDSSEILVCEVDDELGLSERDQQMIATLREAHERSEKNLHKEESDAYQSVRVKMT